MFECHPGLANRYTIEGKSPPFGGVAFETCWSNNHYYGQRSSDYHVLHLKWDAQSWFTTMERYLITLAWHIWTLAIQQDCFDCLSALLATPSFSVRKICWLLVKLVKLNCIICYSYHSLSEGADAVHWCAAQFSMPWICWFVVVRSVKSHPLQ